jgi:hypothetical protein
VKKILFVLLMVGVLVGATTPALAQCTSTTNLSLCKGARSQLDWDTFINSNFDIIDSSLINTLSTAQTKTGVLSLSNATPLKLTNAVFASGDVLFLTIDKSISKDSLFYWSPTTHRLALGHASPAAQLDVVGTIKTTAFLMATGAGAGYVLTSDGSGNASWQAAGAAATGFTDGGTSVYLTTNTDKVSLTDSTATEKLEVGGGVVLGAASATQTGTIQWNGTHFTGYNGSGWVELDLSAGSAGGWTDGGTDVTLTAATDLVGIGAAVDADAKVNIVPDANLSAIKVSGYSLTGSDASSMFNLAGTWNTTGNPTAFKMTITNTASGSGAKLWDLIVGTTSMFSVDKAGTATAVNLTASTKTTTPALQVTTSPTNGYVLTSDASGNATWQAAGAGTIPSGLIALFDTACPSGWTSLSGAGGVLENRFAMGVASYTGTPAGASTHTHTVDPAAVNSTTDGSHYHTVDPPNSTTGYASAVNTVNETSPTTKYVAEDHTHDIDIAVFNSGTGGSHYHSVDIASTTSSAGSSLPPYVGLVYCKKT